MNYNMKSSLFISKYIDSNSNLEEEKEKINGFHIKLVCQIFFSHFKINLPQAIFIKKIMNCITPAICIVSYFKLFPRTESLSVSIECEDDRDHKLL